MLQESLSFTQVDLSVLPLLLGEQSRHWPDSDRRCVTVQLSISLMHSVLSEFDLLRLVHLVQNPSVVRISVTEQFSESFIH